MIIMISWVFRLCSFKLNLPSTLTLILTLICTCIYLNYCPGPYVNLRITSKFIRYFGNEIRNVVHYDLAMQV